MATIDVPPTYEETVALLKRWRTQAPTADEVRTFSLKANVSLGNPQAVEDFKTRYPDLANAAVETDNAFDQVNRTLGQAVVIYQASFPGLTGFRVQWQGYKTRWDTNLRRSRDLASASALNLQGYEMILELIVQDIVTEQDIRDAIKLLTAFNTGRPSVQIPDDLAQQFLDLKRDVDTYQQTFSEYLENTGVKALKIIFDALGQSFQITGSSLALFANVWREFYLETGKFVEILKKLINSELFELFEMRVKLARQVCDPLREFLDLYASTIQNYDVTIKVERKE